MTYLERIHECNRFDLESYAPLNLAGVDRLGWIRRDRIDLVREAAVGLPIVVTAVSVELGGVDPDARTSTLRLLCERLVASGVVPALYGELYPITPDFDLEPALALIDRSCVAWFGIRARGVHINGFVRDPSGLQMWIATRARGKPTFPGMLDNMVAGGQPHGISLTDNVYKECAEEAGIPAELASRAVAAGPVSYVAEHASGLKPDTMLCFDLELPREFRPTCVDGEVESFELLPIDDVAELVRDTTRFKFNCNLVILDFLVRHRYLTESLPDYPEIVRGLRGGLPSEARPRRRA